MAGVLAALVTLAVAAGHVDSGVKGVALAEDGQILVDKSRKFQFELGQWIDPDSFLQIS